MAFCKKNRKGLLLTLAMAMVLVIVLVACAKPIQDTLPSSGPAGTVVTALSKTFESSKENMFGLMNKVAEGGSVEVNADLSKWEMLNHVNAQVQFNSYFNLSKMQQAESIKLVSNGKSIEAAFYREKMATALQCDALLGSNIYGIDVEAMKANLPGSIFAPNSGSEYAMPQEIYDLLMNQFGAGANLEPLVQDTLAVLKPYINVITTTFDENAKIEESTATVTVGSKEVQTNQISITVDGSTMSKVVEAVGTKAKDDEALKEVASKWIDLYVGAQPGISIEEVQKDFWNDFENNLDDVVKAIAESEAKVVATFNISTSTKTVVAFDIAVSVASDSASFKMLLDEKTSIPEKADIVVKADGENVTITYLLKENSDKALSATVTAIIDEENVEFGFNWNKESHAYEIYGFAEGQRMSASGEFTLGKGEATMSLNKINMAGEVMKLDLTVTLREKGSFTMPKFTDVLTLKEEDIAQLMDTAVKNLEKIERDFGDLFDAFG